MSWIEKSAFFYWEESNGTSVPTTHTDDSYSQVVSRMTDKLKNVYLKPNIANNIEVVWMPGPRYSCDPSESLWSFPDEAIRLIESEITRCIQPEYLDFYLKGGWQESKCLSTVPVFATILLLFQNVKELKISGGRYIETKKTGDKRCAFGYHPGYDTRQMWGPETFFKFIKSLESHTKP